MNTLTPDKLVTKYLNKQAAAALLGISPRSLDIWMSRGLVPYLKIGRTVRFDPADLHAYLTSKCRVVNGEVAK